MPRRLGQHFLKDEYLLRRLARLATGESGDKKIIIEIGPGHGELTKYLVQSGQTILAIEKDKRFIPVLERKFKEVMDQGIFRLVFGDVLRWLPQIIEEAGSRPYAIVGNIPYGLSGRLLRILGELEPRPREIVLTLQKEVGERLAAGPPRMNRLASSVQFWAEPKILFPISREAFRPRPEVESVVVSLESRPQRILPGLTLSVFNRCLGVLFRQPRKTILNNLLALLAKEEVNNFSRARLSVALQNLAIEPNDRPQNLTLEQIVKLAETFFRGDTVN